MLPSHTCTFWFEVSLKAQCSVVERVLFCSVMRQTQKTLFQKYLCLIVSTLSLSSILLWKWEMCVALGVSDQFPGGSNETDFSWFEWKVLVVCTEVSNEPRFIFHTVYIDEIKCNNASVKLIFGDLVRGIERRPVSGWEACNVTVISAFYELIKAPVSPSPITIL